MAGPRAPTPLQPHEFFGREWTGTGEWIPRHWLRWLPGPRRFEFHSCTSPISGELWLVHDTTTWENGFVERRDGTARLVAPDRIRLTYDDMLGGAEMQLHAEGFTFSPYRVLSAVPVLPIPVVIDAHDECRWDAATGELRDTIELRFLGIRLGRMAIRLRPKRSNSRS